MLPMIYLGVVILDLILTFRLGLSIPMIINWTGMAITAIAFLIAWLSKTPSYQKRRILRHYQHGRMGGGGNNPLAKDRHLRIRTQLGWAFNAPHKGVSPAPSHLVLGFPSQAAGSFLPPYS